MPAIQYWFSGAALYLAGSFAFAIVVGLIGIKSMISPRLFILMMGIALLLTILAWRTAAKQEEASAKQDADNAELKINLGKIANSANIDPNQSVESLANKIIEKMRPLAEQVDKLANPPREEDGLYQDKKLVARFVGARIDESKTVISFNVVTSSQRQLDFSKEFEVQNNRMSCTSVNGPNNVSQTGAVSTFSYGDVVCKYLGPVK